MGLFDKKYCDICGNQIKLLGNRKVEDGNICKDCASKLSPWFSDRKRSTVADIKEQLEYRERNRHELNSFRPDANYGDKVYVDNTAKKFVVARTSDYRKENADLLQLSDVIVVEGSIDEDATEVTYKDEEGKEKSYEPAQFTYEYDFYVTIKVAHKYFDDMKFKLNSSSLDTQSDPKFAEYVKMINDISVALTGRECNVTVSTVEVGTESELAEGEWLCPQCGTKNAENFCSSCGAAKPVGNLVSFCPNCGTKIPDASTRFCPHCGKALY